MGTFFEAHTGQIIATLTSLGVFLILRFLLVKTIRRIGKSSEINKLRTRLVVRYVSFALAVILLVVLVLVWGVNLKELGLILSSVFAVIGVALFATWSILSNVTSGIILFFYFPYQIGDRIRIQDKDFPDEAVIVDIRSFTIHLLKDDGELLTYPNNLLLQKGVVLLKTEASI